MIVHIDQCHCVKFTKLNLFEVLCQHHFAVKINNIEQNLGPLLKISFFLNYKDSIKITGTKTKVKHFRLNYWLLVVHWYIEQHFLSSRTCIFTIFCTAPRTPTLFVRARSCPFVTVLDRDFRSCGWDRRSTQPHTRSSAGAWLPPINSSKSVSSILIFFFFFDVLHQTTTNLSGRNKFLILNRINLSASDASLIKMKILYFCILLISTEYLPSFSLVDKDN